MTEPRETMRERLLDTALREVTGERQNLDLAPRVRAELDGIDTNTGDATTGETVMEIRIENGRARWAWWLAAAASVCVAALLLFGGDGPPPEPTAPASVAPTAWGEAANGLQVGLDAPRTTWTSGENLTFSVRARNVGETALRLELFEHFWFHRIRFESLDGEPDWEGGAGFFADFTELPVATLDPGEGAGWKAEPYDGERRYLRIIPDRKPGMEWDYRDRLPPGRYRISVSYARRAPSGRDPAREGHWSGTATSNTIDITILPEEETPTAR